MREFHLIAAEIEKEAERRTLGLPGESGVAKQIVGSAITKRSDALAIFQSQLEPSVMHSGSEPEAVGEAAHAAVLLTEQRDSAIDQETLDAVGGHASADARFRFEDQRGEAAVLAAQRGRQTGDSAADDDYIRIFR